MAIDPAFAWRGISLLMLGWLAFFFGRTLRPGHEALITRIARIGDPALPAHLVRYTRRLTGVWSAYFVLVALASLGFPPSPWLGLAVWAGTVLLFVGEHALRRRLFPDQSFPGLRQQVRDTVLAWRPVPRNGD